MTTGREVTLAIDCGSTNFKVALFDPALNRIAEGAARVAYRPGRPQIVEFDVEPFWAGAIELIRTTCADAGIAGSEITRLAITSQAQTFTVMDTTARTTGRMPVSPSRGDTGFQSVRPLIPFVSWMDKRPVVEAAALQSRFGKEFHQHCSFWMCIPQLQLAKLSWVRQQRDFTVESASRSSALQNCGIVALPTFVSLRLTGLDVIDRNAAAMSGLYSLKNGDWWHEAVEAAGWNSNQLSTLIDVGVTIPAAGRCAEFVLSEKLQVTYAGNDQTAGAFGAGLRDDGVVLTLGTALVAYRHAGTKPGPYHPAGIWGPYPGGGYYELATRDEGCAALDWAIERLAPGTDPDAFRALGQKAMPCAARFYPQRLGSETAWTGATDLASRALAVIEGISFSARQLIAEELGAASGASPIQVLGGGAQSATWLQLLANILNRPVQRGSGDTLLGAAMMADSRAKPRRQEGEIFKPVAQQVELYDRLYRAWLA